jgi:hypothetical protein
MTGIEAGHDSAPSAQELAMQVHEQTMERVKKINAEVEKIVRFYEEGTEAMKEFVEVEDTNSYLDYLSAVHGVPKKVLLAIMCKESMFKPDAKNGDMIGLGQFTTDTWVDFQKSLTDASPHLGEERTDSRAAMEAVAWRCNRIANRFDLDLSTEDGVMRLYEAYRLGNTGFLRLQKWRNEGIETHIPAGNEGNVYSRYGITVETYEDFAAANEKMAYDVYVLTQWFEKAFLKQKQDS